MARKKEIYGYVLYVEATRLNEPLVRIYQTLADAEQALHDYAATIWAGLSDEELVDAFDEEEHARVFVFKCSNRGSTELTPFARSSKAA